MAPNTIKETRTQMIKLTYEAAAVVVVRMVFKRFMSREKSDEEVRFADIRVYLNRTSERLGADYEVFEGVFYMRRYAGFLSWDQEDLGVVLIYEEDPVSSVRFTPDKVSSETLGFTATNLTIFQYFRLMGISVRPTGKSLFRFNPTEWEVKKYKNDDFAEFLIAANGSPLSEYVGERYDVNELRALVGEFLSIAAVDPDPEKGAGLPAVPTHADMDSLVSQMSNAAILTAGQVSRYEKFRHDYFAASWANESEIPIPEHGTDKRWDRVFPWSAGLSWSRGSPDIIIKLNATTYVVYEFTVTNANVNDIMFGKRTKYQEAISAIRAKNIDIDLVVVVADLTEWRVLRSDLHPSTFDMTTMKNLIQTFESTEAYKNAKATLNSMPATTDNKRMTELQAVIFEKMAFKADYKAISMAGTRSADIAYDFVSNVEDPIAVVYSSTIVNNDVNKAVILEALQSGVASKRYCPEVAAIASSSGDTVEASIVAAQRFLSETAATNRIHVDVPKYFPFPLLPEDSTAGMPPADWVIHSDLDDGSKLYTNAYLPHEPRSGEEPLSIGATAEDVDNLQTLTEMLFDTVLNPGERICEAYMRTTMHSYLSDVESYMREIALLSHRRFVGVVDPDKLSKGISKDYGRFTISIASGTMIQAEKNIRVKFSIKSDYGNIPTTMVFRSWKPTNFDYIYETTWFSVNTTDIDHFITCDTLTKVLLSTLEDKVISNTGALVSSTERVIPEHFSTYAILIAEHKRPTSTALQLNRYIYHAFRGVVSDMVGMTKEIVKPEIRTYVQAAMIWKQTTWARALLRTKKDLFTDVVSVLGEGPQYDKSYAPSFFEPSRNIEFLSTIEEMYCGYLLNQNKGFSGQRNRAILEKMAAEEIKRRAIGPVVDADPEEIMNTANTEHLFSKSFMEAVVEHYCAAGTSQQYVNDAIVTAFSASLEEIVNMHKVLVSGPNPFDDMPQSEWPEKITVFEAVLETFKEADVHKLVTLIETEENFTAFFSSFEKRAIGGSREVFVQWIRTRFWTRVMEKFYESLCKKHPKEMITKSHEKAKVQSDCARDYRERAQMLNKTNSQYVYIPIAMNADSSKWSPRILMEMFINITSKLNLPATVKEIFTSILRAYASKFVYAPASYVKSMYTPEGIEHEYIRRNFLNSAGMMLFISGMGQGNLQFMSSFYHAIVDDYSDHVMKDIYPILGFGLVETTTLISSDDLSKNFLFGIRVDANIGSAFLGVMDCITKMRKLANITINWKKTALHLLLFEFNSMFSQLKSIYLASIKNVYSAVAVVDMTFPERAVKEVIANIRRLLEDGGYMTTIKYTMNLMRAKLIEWYGYTDVMLTALCSHFSCAEIDLPFQLGFLPTKMSLETLIYGPELSMFDRSISAALEQFHKNMFTASRENTTEKAFIFDADEKVSYRIAFELTSKLDKRFQELKSKLVPAERRSTIMSEADKHALNVNVLASDKTWFCRFLDSFMLNQTRKYAFSESYKVHSLIRALGATGSRFFVRVNFNAEEEERPSTIFEGIETVTLRTGMASMIQMYAPLGAVMTECTEVAETVSNMLPRFVTRHPRLRTFSFYLTEGFARATVAEIIDHIFGSSSSAPWRVRNALTEIAEALGLTYDHFMENPTMAIWKSFSRSDYPQTDFVNFVKLFNKNLGFNTIKMNAEFLPDLDRKKNLLSITRYRTNPAYVLGAEEEASATYMMKMFSNRMVVRGIASAIEICKDDRFEMSERAMPLEIAMGMLKVADTQDISHAFISLPFQVSRSYFATFIWRNMRTYAFTNLNSVILLSKTKGGPMIVNIFKTEETYPSALVSAVVKEFKALRMASTGLTLSGYVNDADIRRHIKNIYDLEKIVRIKANVFATRRAAEWSIKLALFLPDTRREEAIGTFSIATSAMTIYPDVDDLETTDDIATLLSVATNSLTLGEIQTIYMTGEYDVLKPEDVYVEQAQKTDSDSLAAFYNECLKAATADSILASGAATAMDYEAIAGDDYDNNQELVSAIAALSLSTQDAAETGPLDPLYVRKIFIKAIEAAVARELSFNMTAAVRQLGDDPDCMWIMVLSKLSELTRLNPDMLCMIMAVVSKKFIFQIPEINIYALRDLTKTAPDKWNRVKDAASHYVSKNISLRDIQDLIR